MGTVIETYTDLFWKWILSEFPHCLSESEQWTIKSSNYFLNLLP